MAAKNPIPETIRRQVWDILRPFKDMEIPIFGPVHVKLEIILSHLLGYDRGASESTPPVI